MSASYFILYSFPPTQAVISCDEKSSDYVWNIPLYFIYGLLWWLNGKRIHVPKQETWAWALDQEDPLEMKRETHSNNLA